MNKLYNEIKKCRICGNSDLVDVVDLGDMALTGVFPKSKEEEVGSGPLVLVKCHGDNHVCGLLQLKHNYDLSRLYGKNYGYRSGLNKSMIEHLQKKVRKNIEIASPAHDDLIIDIGSNDSTLLQGYPQNFSNLVGVDPTGVKFSSYYPSHIRLIPDFFSASLISAKYGNKKAKIVTSISMFYDLENPLDFVSQIYEVLDDNGIWVFEQSYMPEMIRMNSYDTICHEHLEYYSLKQIKYMCDKVGFKIIDVEFNDINGGSFSIIVSKKNSKFAEAAGLIDKILDDEENEGFNSLDLYKRFNNNILKHKTDFIKFIKDVNASGKKIFGYGASTKGNVILQYCGITEKDIPYIAEVNEDKFGSYTPGTLIKIISEAEVKTYKPDYLLVLPWHFKEFIVEKETEYIRKSGCKLLFPLPVIGVFE